MDAYLERINTLKLEAAHDYKATLNAAAAENRDLTPEDTEKLDKIDAVLDRYTAEEKRIVDAEKKIGPAADKLRASLEPAIAEARVVRPDMSERALLTKILNGESREISGRNNDGVAFSHSDAFLNEMTSPTRALAGYIGTAIPTVFADFVTVYERTLSPVYALATVIPTRNGEPIVLPRVTADSIAGGSVTAEAGGITEGDLTLSMVTLNAYKRAWTSIWSNELNDDNVIGLENLISAAIARPLGLNWGSAFTLGNDSTEANGFLNAGTNGGTAAGTAGNQASDTFFAASDLVDLFYSLAAPYRANASWMVSNSALIKMRKFRDSTGQFLWSPALQAGQPESFLGRPVYENPHMATVASAAKSVAVGDFSKYVIRDVLPMRVDLSEHYKFSTDQLALRVVTRRDGDLPDVIAVKYQVAANT